MGTYNSTLSTKAKTQLLVSGYIRENLGNVIIVPDAIQVIICDMNPLRSDTWNKQWTAENYIIDEETNCISYHQFNKTYRSKLNHYQTAYGNKIIKSGDLYQCKIRINKAGSGIGGIHFGIIPNDYNMYNEYYIVSTNWLNQVQHNGIGYFLNCRQNAFIYHDPESHNNVCGRKWLDDPRANGWQPPPILDNGYSIEMIVDLTKNKSSISFIINGEDYGIIYDKILKTKSYRMIVTSMNIKPGAEIELI